MICLHSTLLTFYFVPNGLNICITPWRCSAIDCVFVTIVKICLLRLHLPIVLFTGAHILTNRVDYSFCKCNDSVLKESSNVSIFPSLTKLMTLFVWLYIVCVTLCNLNFSCFFCLYSSILIVFEFSPCTELPVTSLFSFS